MGEENQKITLSMDTIRSLKCAFCDSYLTVPPIFITALNGNEWKCGRCTSVTTDFQVPALLFETVAINMTFPCIYLNCPAQIHWDGVKEHEEACHFRPMKCPCGETVEFHLALWHFRNQHPDIISYNQAVVENPDYCRLLTRLILANHVPFMVYILCERKAEIKVGVYCLQEVLETYEVQVKISTNRNNCSITLPNKKISKFKLRENCADCLLKTCNVRYHKYYESNQNLIISNVYEMMNVRVNALSVLNVLDSEDIILTINIIEEIGLANREVTLNKNEQVRKSWECQICQEYLVGPIFICPTGHSLCGSCKSKLTICPYCVLVIGDSRNFSLEEMAECAEVACQYEGKGCNFVGNVERIAKHERTCSWNKDEELPSGKKKIRFTV